MAVNPREVMNIVNEMHIIESKIMRIGDIAILDKIEVEGVEMNLTPEFKQALITKYLSLRTDLIAIVNNLPIT